jgi:hypothetical protein
MTGEAVNEGRWGDAALFAGAAALPFVAGPAIKKGIDYAMRKVGPVGDVPVGADSMESALVELEAMRAMPVQGQLSSYSDAVKHVPGFRPVGKYLTDEERALFETPQWRQGAESVVAAHMLGPSTQERMLSAQAGGAKRGWYKDSEVGIRTIFENPEAPDDPERFTALLAALSPQASVQSNLKNALATWSNWKAAGRPTDPNKILAIMGKSVEGDKGVKSVLGAWRNNAYRALTTQDARELMGPVGLSGPKVHSFMRNLMGNPDEVTNDAWIAKVGGLNQGLFGGANRMGIKDEFGNLGIKGAGYLAENAAQRRAMERLGWDPMEGQETTWSFAKTLADLAESPNAVIKSMEEFGVPVPDAYRSLEPMSAQDVLREGLLTDEAIAAVPAFGDLMKQEPYRGLLEQGGYSPDGIMLPKPELSSPYERIGIAPEDLDNTKEGKLLLKSAGRLDAARRRTEAISAVETARELQRLAETPADKKRAASRLGQARRQLRRSVRELPNIPLEKDIRKELAP